MEKALYLIPVPMSEIFDAEENKKALPEKNAEIVRQIRHFIVESRKSAVRFLISLDKDFPIDDCTFTELSEHTDEKASMAKILEPLEKKGEPMGVISDAGCPAVGDPGNRAVEEAHRKNLRVIPLVGPNSMIMSVMASGFNGQNFAFNGYLPVKNGERESRIKQLETRMYKEDQTQLFIEAPYRNEKMFEAILKSCRNETKLCIASGLTGEKEFVKTKTIQQWKKEKTPPINKIPTMFLIYK
ncbi:MAG: SAM-dependent methyltransferase [Treponema sp.]|nr:SAM-dependent methyltransferase [Treponema sp.]